MSKKKEISNVEETPVVPSEANVPTEEKKKEISPLDGIPYGDIDVGPGEDFENVRREPSYIKIGKPKGQQWFQVHPTIQYRICMVKREGSSDEYYVVTKPFIPLCGRQAIVYDLYLGILKTGNGLILYPVPQHVEGKKPMPWYTSALECIDHARKGWIRAEWIRDSNSWDILSPDEVFAPPIWPDFLNNSDEKAIKDKIYGLAFRGCVINSEDHPVIKDLKGRIE